MGTTVALVLAGGNVGGYGVLTRNRTKAALPFAGHYRIIDFALSNLSNSGITSIGVITQYLPASLIEHVGGGDAWDLHGSGRMIKIMPPFVGVGHTTWFRGTSDAIYRNLNFVYDLDPEDVIILSGEHIYHMDYQKAIAFHRSRDALLTIVGQRLPRERLSLRFGFLDKDDQHRVLFFKEKPREYVSDLISMGIYIFKKDFLIRELSQKVDSGITQNLVFDIIEPLCAREGIYAYEFQGFWEYLENYNHYYSSNMLLLGSESPIKPVEWEIVTNLEDRDLGTRHPVLIGRSAHVVDALISPGCLIEGTVIRSVLSPGVHVHEGATVEDSIVMHDCVIHPGAHLWRVLADKDVIVERDAQVGGRLAEPYLNPELPESPLGITIIGKGAIIGERIRIEGYSQVYPQKDLRSYAGTHFAPGVNIT